jgi:hypothetical protein
MATQDSVTRRETLLKSVLDPGRMTLGPAALDSEGLDQLVAALESVAADDNNKDIANALRCIAEGRPGKESARLAARFLLDPDADQALKRQAASALARMPGDEADDALSQALASADPSEEAPLLQALATAGSAKGLKAIRDLPRTQSARLKNLRAYAETALAFRTGDKVEAETERLMFPSSSPLRIQRETPEALAAIVGALEGRPFGLDFGADIGFSFDCAGKKHVMLLNRDVEPGKFLDALRGERKIVGIIAMEDGARGAYKMRRAIFLRPERGGARLSIVSPVGEVVMAGSLRDDGDSMALELRDMVTERSPINVTGRVTKDDLELSAEVFVEAARPKQTGEDARTRRS